MTPHPKIGVGLLIGVDIGNKGADMGIVGVDTESLEETMEDNMVKEVDILETSSIKHHSLAFEINHVVFLTALQVFSLDFR